MNSPKKFKPGDRVKIITSTYDEWKPGDIVTVHSVELATSLKGFNLWHVASSTPVYFYENEAELFDPLLRVLEIIAPKNEGWGFE